MGQRIDLISNGSTTSAGKRFKGGKGSLAAVGTFNSGSITLQILGPDGSTYVPVTSPEGTAIALSAAGSVWFECPEGLIRAAVGGSPSAMYVTVVGH